MQNKELKNTAADNKELKNTAADYLPTTNLGRHAKKNVEEKRPFSQ